jgi:hypothetical protein
MENRSAAGDPPCQTDIVFFHQREIAFGPGVLVSSYDYGILILPQEQCRTILGLVDQKVFFQSKVNPGILNVGGNNLGLLGHFSLLLSYLLNSLLSLYTMKRFIQTMKRKKSMEKATSDV